MIQDFRETLEVTPLLPTDGVSLDMMPDHMPLCLNKTPSNFMCLFVFPRLIKEEFVCVSESVPSVSRVWQKSLSVSHLKMKSKVKQKLTKKMFCLPQRVTERRSMWCLCRVKVSWWFMNQSRGWTLQSTWTTKFSTLTTPLMRVPPTTWSTCEYLAHLERLLTILVCLWSVLNWLMYLPIIS